MKRFLSIVTSLLVLTSHGIFAQDTWVQKASLDSPINNGSYGCNIGNKAYIIAGSSPGSYFENAPKNSFYEYDPATDAWTKKANTPEQTRDNGLAFSIGTKGYYALSGGIWEYDATANVWTRKLVLPAGIASFQIGFSIGTKAYFGWGTGKDFWEYDPATNIWTAKADFPGNNPLFYHTGFSIGSKGYIAVTGNGLDPVNKNDFWEYNPLSNTWLARAKFGGQINIGSTGFSIAGKGYITTSFQQDPDRPVSETHLWQYDTTLGVWAEKAQLPKPRTLGVGFSIGNKGYIAFGTITYRTGARAANDLWEYTPDITVTPPVPVGTGAGLRGVYYNGINLEGSPLLTRIDTSINFELIYATHVVLSPAPGIVPEDKYSVRWTGQVQPQYSETYTFYTQSDDGIRLWVNGVKLVDNWTNQSVTEKSGTIALIAGQKYDIVIEYYENTGEAVTKLLWSGASTPKSIVPKSQLYTAAPAVSTGTGLQGVYYNGVNLSGNPLLTRIDGSINFDLSYGNQPQVLSPAPGIVPEDKYSVRWTGQVQALQSGTYTFYTLADDGVRLWVNGVQLVDNWTIQGATENSGTITLGAGFKYDIVIEYFENTGNAVTKLYWSGPGTPKAIIPTAQLYPPVTGIGLQGVYYNGIDLSGTVLLTRIDTTINFELTYSKQPQVLSPAPGIVPEDKYSVRWTGQVLPLHSETYTFYTLSDDGVRLWVNGSKLVDNWVNQSATEKSGTIALVAGQKYDIVLEYFENTGEAVTKLYWSGAGTPKQIIPASQLFTPAVSNGTAMANTVALRAIETSAIQPVDKTIAAGISPNPVSSGTLVRLAVNNNKVAPALLYVTGSNGHIINTHRLNLVAGMNNIMVNTGGFAPGMYVITITGASKPFNVKLVVQ